LSPDVLDSSRHLPCRFGRRVAAPDQGEGELFWKVERAVKRVNPYEIPEIIEVRVQKGSRQYLDWIGREATRGREGNGRSKAP